MSRVKEIKAAIDQLSPEERCELAAPVQAPQVRGSRSPRRFRTAAAFASAKSIEVFGS